MPPPFTTEGFAAMTTIATIGFGEAAQAFVAGWQSETDASRIERFSTFDIKIEDPALRASIVGAAERLSVRPSEQARQAVDGADAVFSLVTADRALEAAQAASQFLAADTFYFDCNSCSPATKQKSAAIVEKAGARYVDVAVMAPVYPARHRTPLLVSGPKVEGGVLFLTRLGMKARGAGTDVGRASSIKMLRSVMVKGIEALTAECFLAARRAGVEADVIASLQASDPNVDWTSRGAYNLERMMVHGKRRAAEMREVALTLKEFGLPFRMASATVDWQDEIGSLGLRADADALVDRADLILEHYTD